MITYIMLLVCIFIILILAYKTFNKDLLSPTLISAAIFLLGTIFAIIGRISWNRVNELSVLVIVIIPLGLISFFLGELIARKYKIKNMYKFNIINKIEEKNNITTIVLFLCLFFVIITTVLLLLEIKKICAYYGFYSKNISELLAFYRTKTELFSTSLTQENISVSFIVKQMKKISEVINIVISFLFIRRFINKELKNNILNTILLFFIMFVGLIQTFLNSGGRSILMHFLVAYLIMYMLNLIEKNKNRNTSNIKLIMQMGCIAIVIFVIFYAILPLVGRSSSYKFVDYITFYIGSPIPSFSTFIEKNAGLNQQIGSETFSSIYYMLNRFGIIKYSKPFTLEWLSFSDGLASNVYTSMRCYYHDFGILGVIVLQFIFGYVYTKFYLKAKNSKLNLWKMIYAYYAYILIDQIRTEQFYGLINTSTIAMLIMFLAVYLLIFCRVKKGKKEYELE